MGGKGPHPGSIIRILKDSEEEVQRQCTTATGQMEPQVLGVHQCLSDSQDTLSMLLSHWPFWVSPQGLCTCYFCCLEYCSLVSLLCYPSPPPPSTLTPFGTSSGKSSMTSTSSLHRVVSLPLFRLHVLVEWPLSLSLFYKLCEGRAVPFWLMTPSHAPRPDSDIQSMLSP